MPLPSQKIFSGYSAAYIFTRYIRRGRTAEFCHLLGP